MTTHQNGNCNVCITLVWLKLYSLWNLCLFGTRLKIRTKMSCRKDLINVSTLDAIVQCLRQRWGSARIHEWVSEWVREGVSSRDGSLFHPCACSSNSETLFILFIRPFSPLMDAWMCWPTPRYDGYGADPGFDQKPLLRLCPRCCFPVLHLIIETIQPLHSALLNGDTGWGPATLTVHCNWT